MAEAPDDDEIEIICYDRTPPQPFWTPNPVIKRGTASKIFESLRSELNMKDDVSLPMPLSNEARTSGVSNIDQGQQKTNPALSINNGSNKKNNSPSKKTPIKGSSNKKGPSPKETPASPKSVIPYYFPRSPEPKNIRTASNHSNEGSPIASTSSRALVFPEKPTYGTPQRSNGINYAKTLTPEQIHDLTDGCLDSDNEPEEISILSPPKEPVSATSSRTNLSREGSSDLIKPGTSSAITNPKSSPSKLNVSRGIRSKPYKFFGSQATEEQVVSSFTEDGDLNSLSDAIRTNKSSPSSKRKRVSSTSPFRSVKKVKRNLSSKKTSARRSLDWDETKECSQTLRSAVDEAVQTASAGYGDVPYYFESFVMMTQEVFKTYKHLFHPSELEIESVLKLKKEFQLYVRLFNRTGKWHRAEKIKYPDIAVDLAPLFKTLEEKGLLDTDTSGEDLQTLLLLLRGPEIAPICKTFKTEVQKKQDMIDSLCKLNRIQGCIDNSNRMRECVMALLGPCVRLNDQWKKVFMRIVILFSMFHSRESLSLLGNTQTYLLLQVKLQKLVFPVQQVTRDLLIFQSRDQVVRYMEALELYEKLMKSIEEKDTALTETLCTNMLSQFRTLIGLDNETSWVQELPVFTRHLTTGSVYAHALTAGAKSLKESIDLKLQILNTLIDQEIYCLHYFGKWINMLTTLLIKPSIKNFPLASFRLCMALERLDLHPNVRQDLEKRAKKLLALKDFKADVPTDQTTRLYALVSTDPNFSRTITINARVIPGTQQGQKSVYVVNEGDDRTLQSVEDVAWSFYEKEGYSKGRHDEGSLISAMCILVFWDLIYDVAIPNVFQSPYQNHPLDWGSEDFFTSRKPKLLNFANFLLLNEAKLKELLKTNYEQHFNKTCLVNWSIFEGVDLEEFLQCVSVAVFMQICIRLLSNWRNHKPGFPDLTLWNTREKKCLFVEVKGPKDVLSGAQFSWLRFLEQARANPVVAHVTTTGSKKQNN